MTVKIIQIKVVSFLRTCLWFLEETKSLSVHKNSQNNDICIQILKQNADIFQATSSIFWTVAQMKITLQMS